MTRAFIDSCVFIAAIRSPGGGSGEVLRYALAEHFVAVISNDVIEEVSRYFYYKFPCLNPALQSLFDLVPFQFANPTVEDVIETAHYTPDKDQAIVAGAVAGKVDYLVTLDKKHLLNKSTQIEAHVSFRVVRPEDLLAVLRHQN